MPDWGQYLSDLTLEFCRVIGKQSDRRGTLAVCLPRIEYAWCFVAMGVARSLPSVPATADHVSRLRPFVGHKVLFVDGAGNEVRGELQSVPNADEEQLVRVVVRRVAEAQGARLRLGGASETTQLLDAQSWPSIKVISDGPQDEHAAFRFNAAPTAQVSEALLRFAQTALGATASDWLLGSNKTHVSAYGTRSRMLQELKSTIKDPEGKERWEFADLLKPCGNGLPQQIGRVRVVPSSELHEKPRGEALPSMVVVEPSVRMHQLLANTDDFHRILLLARNSPSYSESATDLLEAFIRRADGELSCASVESLPHIFYRSFYHA
jgi:hypothetical protein